MDGCPSTEENDANLIFRCFPAQAAAAGAVAFTVATSPAIAADVDAGEQVFNANCAACHAGGQNVIMPEKTLEKEALDQYLAGGRSEKSIVNQVTNGKNAMPAFGGRLSDEDISNVAAYVIASSDAGWE
jgi:cytochrome c6